MHGLIPEDALGVGMGLDIVNLDGDDLLGGDLGQDLGVIALAGPDPVPGVQDQLGVVTAGGLHHGPGLLHIGEAAVGHGLHADGVLPGPVAELLQLLGGVLHRVGLHEAAVDLVHAEELAHVEAELLLVLLLVGAVLLRPLDDVLHLRDLHAVLFQDGQDVGVEEALVQGVHIGLRPEADALKARVLGGGDPLLKAALIAQGPGADGDGILLRHGRFLLYSS